MTDIERELVTAMYDRFDWRCFVCSNNANQRAHIIGNTKLNRKRFGDDVIDSPLNWLPACSLSCNSLIDIGYASVLPDKMAELIRRGHRQSIYSMVRENIDRKHVITNLPANDWEVQG